jgi:hypothetical protein
MLPSHPHFPRTGLPTVLRVLRTPYSDILPLPRNSTSTIYKYVCTYICCTYGKTPEGFVRSRSASERQRRPWFGFALAVGMTCRVLPVGVMRVASSAAFVRGCDAGYSVHSLLFGLKRVKSESGRVDQVHPRPPRADGPTAELGSSWGTRQSATISDNQCR